MSQYCSVSIQSEKGVMLICLRKGTATVIHSHLLLNLKKFRSFFGYCVCPVRFFIKCWKLMIVFSKSKFLRLKSIALKEIDKRSAFNLQVNNTKLKVDSDD